MKLRPEDRELFGRSLKTIFYCVCFILKTYYETDTFYYWIFTKKLF